MNEALQTLIGKTVEIESEGVGRVRGTLQVFADPWLQLHTDKKKLLCVPIERIYYVQSTEP